MHGRLGLAWGKIITFVQVLQGLQDAPAEGGHGVLHAGAEAEQALQVRLPQQLLPVSHELRRAAEQGGHVVHELGYQAGVGIVGLAVVVSHDLAKRKEQKKNLCVFIRAMLGRSCERSGFAFGGFDLFWQVKSLRAMSVNYP